MAKIIRGCNRSLFLALGVRCDEWVDLGLPSGTLWATKNIGANRPEEYGIYFTWGNRYGSSWELDQTSDYPDTEGGALTESYQGGGIYDPARASLDVGWKTPSKTNMQELIDNCSYVTTYINGIKCRKLTSNINGKFILFPCTGYSRSGSNNYLNKAGYLWTRDYHNSNNAYGCALYDSGMSVTSFIRDQAFPIRPVR